MNVIDLQPARGLDALIARIEWVKNHMGNDASWGVVCIKTGDFEHRISDELGESRAVQCPNCNESFLLDDDGGIDACIGA